MTAIGRIWRWALPGLGWAARLAALWVAVTALWVASYAVINPPGTVLIAGERSRLGQVERVWRDLEEVSPHMRRAVIAAEDARFCSHYGVDFDALSQAWRQYQRTGRLRGASTITQQTAKNAFLWVERSFVRKGLEFWFAGLIELFWSKERTLEIYLNIIEFDEGVFGVEAAAQGAFNRSAEKLRLDQAARLAAVLPAPKSREAKSGRRSFVNRVERIADGARTLEANGEAACVGA